MLKNRLNNATSFPFEWHSSTEHLLASRWQDWSGRPVGDRATIRRRGIVSTKRWPSLASMTTLAAMLMGQTMIAAAVYDAKRYGLDV